MFTSKFGQRLQHWPKVQIYFIFGSGCTVMLPYSVVAFHVLHIKSLGINRLPSILLVRKALKNLPGQRCQRVPSLGQLRWETLVKARGVEGTHGLRAPSVPFEGQGVNFPLQAVRA